MSQVPQMTFCSRLIARAATPALLAALGLSLAGCGHDAGRSAAGTEPNPEPGDTRPVLKQGGGVPPQPAQLDRADPPLVEAARSGDAKRVRSLLDGGADVNAFGNKRTTALMAAAEAGNEEVARVLIERHADANLRNAEGRTAAEVADAAGHGRLRALLERTEVKPPPGPANPEPAK
jgi:ankyrin repeat protein